MNDTYNFSSSGLGTYDLLGTRLATNGLIGPVCSTPSISAA